MINQLRFINLFFDLNEMTQIQPYLYGVQVIKNRQILYRKEFQKK